jgi:hypothetical protein
MFWTHDPFMEETMLRLSRLIQLTATLAFVVAAVGSARAAEAPGECGEYRYWTQGKCVDARDKPGRSWTAGVYL